MSRFFCHPKTVIGATAIGASGYWAFLGVSALALSSAFPAAIPAAIPAIAFLGAVSSFTFGAGLIYEGAFLSRNNGYAQNPNVLHHIPPPIINGNIQHHNPPPIINDDIQRHNPLQHTPPRMHRGAMGG